MINFAIDSIANGKRFDGRMFDEYRDIIIKTGVISKAEGSAYVKMGETKVIAGVKVEIGEPYPDTPDEGTMSVNAEFTPLASPEFESGPPGEDATELARVVDRGLRESKCVDFKKLCITKGEKILMLYIDIHIINDGGNLIDCSFLASLAALMNTKIPKLNEDGSIQRKEYDRELEVMHEPIEVTICKVADKFIVDPDTEEEQGIDAKLTVCVREDDMICAMQKQGVGGLTLDETKQMVEMAIEKSKDLRKLLKKQLK